MSVKPYRSWVIGADPSCDILITSETVSGRHCRLTLENTDYWIEDLGSTNGTFLEGQPITRRTLVYPGMKITMGRTVPMPWPAPEPAGGSPGPWAPPIPLPAPVYPAAPVPGVWPAAVPLPAAVPAPVLNPSAVRPQGGSAATKVGIGVLLAAGIAAGALFATREAVVKRCEVCTSEIFRENAFFFQVQEARQRAATFRWCKNDGDAPVTVQRRSLCDNCGKVYDTQSITKPRREEPKDQDIRAGYCSDSCKAIHTGQKVYNEGKEILGKGIEGAGDAIRKFMNR